MRDSIIYVSGYYHIPKRKMPHMGIGRYVRLMPETIKMISGSRLIFFYEEDFIGVLVSRLCENYGVELSLKRREICDLPRRREAEIISENADVAEPKRLSIGREKGVAHFNSMIEEGDRSEYTDNLSIWLSKLDLVVESNRFGAQDASGFAWVDIGISKFNYLRKRWRFSDCQPCGDSLQHYGSPMRFRGKDLPLNASFLQGSAAVWDKVTEGYGKALELACGDGYPDDEETVLSDVVRENPELFQCVGYQYRGRLGQVLSLVERLRAKRGRVF